MGRGGAFDGLEVDGHVVDDGEEACAKEEGKCHGKNYVTIFEEAWGKSTAIAELELREDENDD